MTELPMKIAGLHAQAYDHHASLLLPEGATHMTLPILPVAMGAAAVRRRVAILLHLELGWH